MKKILLIALLMFNSLVTADSHSDTTTILKKETEKKTVSFFKIGGGAFYLPMDNFNDALLQKSISELDNTIPMLSMGFYSFSKRHRYGMDFDIIWSQQAKATIDTNLISGVQMRGFSAMFNSGMNLLSNSQVGLRPMMGFGFFQHVYDFHTHFDDVLNRKIDEQLKIKNKGLVLSGSLNIHFHSEIKEKYLDDNNDGPVMMGMDLEGGVNYYPVNSMKYKGNTISDGPDMSKYSVFAKLSVAFGSNDSKKKHEKKKVINEFCKECCEE